MKSSKIVLMSSFFIPLFCVLLVSYNINAQDYKIDWKYNPDNPVSSISISDNFNFICFISYRKSVTDYTEKKINILNKSGHNIRKFDIDSWDISSKIFITNNAEIFAVIPYQRKEYDGSRTNLSTIVSIDNQGEIRWKKSFKGEFISDMDITPCGEYICLSSVNKLYLLDNQGSQIWKNYYESGDFNKIMISNDASLIITYDNSDKKIHAFDSAGSSLWSMACPEFNGFSMNKKNKITAFLDHHSGGYETLREAKKAHRSLRDIKLLDSAGNIINRFLSPINKNWLDFSISANRDICQLEKRSLKEYRLNYEHRCCLLYPNHGNISGIDWLVFGGFYEIPIKFPLKDNYCDGRGCVRRWFYDFNPPQRTYNDFSPQVIIGHDGHPVIFSSGFEIICFR